MIVSKILAAMLPTLIHGTVLQHAVYTKISPPELKSAYHVQDYSHFQCLSVSELPE